MLLMIDDITVGSRLLRLANSFNNQITKGKKYEVIEMTMYIGKLAAVSKGVHHVRTLYN